MRRQDNAAFTDLTAALHAAADAHVAVADSITEHGITGKNWREERRREMELNEGLKVHGTTLYPAV